MNRSDRIIYSKGNNRQISDLLASMFTCELLAPSKELWLDSPWVSNIPVLDGRGNQYVSINPAWAGTRVSLADVLVQLATRGCTVRIITNDDPRNLLFRDEVARIAKSESIVIEMKLDKYNHAKGLVTDRFALWGSMNFTERGISLNGERVEYTMDKAKLASFVIQMDEDWKRVRNESN